MSFKIRSKWNVKVITLRFCQYFSFFPKKYLSKSGQGERLRVITFCFCQYFSYFSIYVYFNAHFDFKMSFKMWSWSCPSYKMCFWMFLAVFVDNLDFSFHSPGKILRSASLSKEDPLNWFISQVVFFDNWRISVIVITENLSSPHGDDGQHDSFFRHCTNTSIVSSDKLILKYSLFW